MTVPDLTLVPLIDRLRRATIGRYDVYAELGAGGMATVFLALDLALDRKVAIKVMSPVLMSSPGAIDRFRREARTAAALSHPHIVPIHAIGEEPGLAYYVMKYIEGRSLDSVLRTEGKQDVAFAQTILGYVGGALAYAHQRGVVHRDVKPANIMLDREGWCYVTDFGIAKSDDGAGLTKSGVIIGTPHYMCPEQFNSLPITGAADQYALGVVAYELLTGAPPYGGPSIGEVMRGHLFEPIPPVRALSPDVPPELEACVTRMLAKDPADRYPSVADAVEAFGRVSATMERDTRALMRRFAEEGAALQPELHTPTSPVPVRPGTVHHEMVSAPTAPITSPITPERMSRPVLPPTVETAVEAPERPRRRLLVGTLIVALLAVVVWGSLPRDGAGERSLLPEPSADTGLVVAPPTLGTMPSIATADSVPIVAKPTPEPPARVTPPVTAPRQVAPRQTAPAEAAPVNNSAAPVTNAAVTTSTIAIGSRNPFAVLYVNENARGPIGQKGLLPVSVGAGRVRLSIRAENCTSWDSTITTIASQVDTIGFRNPKC